MESKKLTNITLALKQLSDEQYITELDCDDNKKVFFRRNGLIYNLSYIVTDKFIFNDIKIFFKFTMEKKIFKFTNNFLTLINSFNQKVPGVKAIMMPSKGNELLMVFTLQAFIPLEWDVSIKEYLKLNISSLRNSPILFSDKLTENKILHKTISNEEK